MTRERRTMKGVGNRYGQHGSHRSRSVSWLLLPGLLMSMQTASAAQSANSSMFSADERAAVVAYWTAPGRYAIGAPPEAAVKGPWQVRLTPDASRWFWAYQRAVAGPGKPPPNADVKASPAWEKWVQAKLDYDRALAQAAADAANRAVIPGLPGAETSSPAPPGPIPADLLAAVGNPPPFAASVAPRRYTVTFDDGDIYAFTDCVAMRPRYAYYRWDAGVMDAGTAVRNMSNAELDPIFQSAGMTPSEARAAKAVSRLEGGFDAVNTYDTGWVSIGFIQFITGENGAGSLLAVLAREKADTPEAYLRDFRRFGVDVNADGVLVVVDPSTGAELMGNEAVRKVIEDKRLTACFQKAGRRSLEFRTAQIKVARSHYWPADDRVKLTVNGQTIECAVKDVVRSEAGMATLFDRKVNRGTIAPFAEVVSRVMAARGCRTPAEVQKYEREIIAELKYRHDFLADPGLSQPP